MKTTAYLILTQRWDLHRKVLNTMSLGNRVPKELEFSSGIPCPGEEMLNPWYRVKNLPTRKRVHRALRATSDTDICLALGVWFICSLEM